MAIYMKKEANAMLSEEELKKVSGGELFEVKELATDSGAFGLFGEALEEGTILYSNLPELSGETYCVLCGLNPKQIFSGIDLSDLSDAALFEKLLAEGVIKKIQN